MDDAPSYLAEVEAAFTKARGRGLMLAEADVALVDAWEAKGLSVHLVCRALNEGVQAWRAQHGDRRPPPHRLTHYETFVQASAQQYREGLMHKAARKPMPSESSAPDTLAPETDELSDLLNRLRAREKDTTDPRIASIWKDAQAKLSTTYLGLPETIVSEQIYDDACDALLTQLHPQEQTVLDTAVESRLLPERADLGPNGIAIRRLAIQREEVAKLFALEELTNE